ncbi:MAG: TRAP transporter small permease [Nitrospina sp.]|jgi:TRAP-type C4-dicarboxylate transport system permease small subunit|nr:TRAP transporter small permease [Nitrospina sp.]MBT3875783.1 TRAP transporter small permease [Nitrospina sp.]MBT4049230.1 TRAP transporter small permease [Nitrospina sp.]MBT4557198.1 TRAP transporter small permease [Nitrospina sp.]MBT5349394.1 TRAP transporter small permease [Nitrospina sp.]
MHILKQVDLILEKIEGHLIVLILSLMILLSFGQMLLRNFFDQGIIWGDILLRQWVLWLGFLGAAMAVRKNKHISIEIFSNLLSPYWNQIIKAFTRLSAGIISGFLAWAAWSFMIFEKESESVLFLDLPVWIFQIILPYSFMVIALRFIISGATIEKSDSGQPLQ